MLTEDICKALYALPGGVVVPRRRTATTPIIITLLGAALLVINFVAVEDSAGATAMTLITAGATLLLYGLVTTIIRLKSKTTVPYDVEAKCYMHHRERYYEHELLPALRKAVTSNDAEAIEDMPTSNIAAIILIEYRTPGGRRSAYAMYEYKEFDYKPIGEPVIFTR